MRLFKKEKKAVKSNDAIAEKIAKKIMDKQRHLADYLNAKTSRLSRLTISYILFGFCIAFACYCTMLLFNSIN